MLAGSVKVPWGTGETAGLDPMSFLALCLPRHHPVLTVQHTLTWGEGMHTTGLELSLHLRCGPDSGCQMGWSVIQT